MLPPPMASVGVRRGLPTAVPDDEPPSRTPPGHEADRMQRGEPLATHPLSCGIMRSHHESLRAGAVARTVAPYHQNRAHDRGVYARYAMSRCLLVDTGTEGAMDASSKPHWNREEDAHPCNTTDNPTFALVLAARLSRRRFLTGAATGLAMLCAGSLPPPQAASAQSTSGFVPVAGSTEDTLMTPPGYASTVVLRWGDPLVASAPAFDPTTQTAAAQAQQFGYN